MNLIEKRLTIALVLSTLFIVFNVITVADGAADRFYYPIESLLKNTAL